MHKHRHATLTHLPILALALASGGALADGRVVDKVYHPYVDALEKELEFRAIDQRRQPGVETPSQAYQLSLGRSFGQRLFGEIYLLGSRDRDGGTELSAWETELKWQLTEQGQHAADWGLLFEYERGIDHDLEEVSVGLLGEREFGRWSGTANLFLIGEWGQDIDNELEAVLSLQARYRYSRYIEPALEFYAGQDSRGFGPVAMGSLQTGIRRNLRWEAGVIFGLDNESPERTLRLLVEYEF